MKKLNINQFSSSYEYEKALKQLKKQTHLIRKVKQKNGNLHILTHSGEPKELGTLVQDNYYEA